MEPPRPLSYARCLYGTAAAAANDYHTDYRGIDFVVRRCIACFPVVLEICTLVHFNISAGSACLLARSFSWPVPVLLLLLT